MNSISALAALLTALTVSWLLLPLMRTLAFRLGAVDHPGARRMHRQVTPRLGGLAIFAGVCAGISVGAVVAVRETGALGLAWCDGLFSVIVATGACFMILGFVDDVRTLSASVKLSVEVLLALVLFGVGGQIGAVELPGYGVLELGWLPSMLVTVLWVTAVTNAFNMIDGINGLAGGVGLITALGIMVIAFSAGAPGALLLAAVLAGSMISFLRSNLRPGGIFLGDSGSLFVGFMLAAATLLLAQASAQALFPNVGLLLLGLPLIEVVTTVVRRTLVSRTWRRGLGGAIRFLRTELMSPDMGHLHHSLIRGGLRASSTAALLVIAASLYASCSVAIFLVPAHSQTFLVGGGVITLICCAISWRGSILGLRHARDLRSATSLESWSSEPLVAADGIAVAGHAVRSPIPIAEPEVLPFPATAVAVAVADSDADEETEHLAA